MYYSYLLVLFILFTCVDSVQINTLSHLNQVDWDLTIYHNEERIDTNKYITAFTPTFFANYVDSKATVIFSSSFYQCENMNQQECNNYDIKCLKKTKFTKLNNANNINVKEYAG